MFNAVGYRTTSQLIPQVTVTKMRTAPTRSGLHQNTQTVSDGVPRNHADTNQFHESAFRT